MEIRITNLKHDFNNITLIRNKIIRVFELLQNKMDKMKIIYSDFIKNNKSQMFIFGLDSFHFQSKLIDLEHDDMKRMFLAINNRMYCEYFKLYKIVVSYISENISDKKIIEIIKANNFPIYKDLEPFKDYKFEKIMEIHDNILILLNSIISIINDRENELMIHKNNQLIGLNIDNFVNSFNFEIVIMKEKINLFLTYIEFFQKLHEKYLSRFSNKIVLMLNHINSDIHFDDNIENNVNKNKNNDETIEYEMNNDYIENNNNNFNIPKNMLHSRPESPSSESTKSNYSYTSNQSKGSISFKIPKIIKSGIKTVHNLLNGCNTIQKIDSDLKVNNRNNIDLICFEELYKENEIMKDNDINIYELINKENMDITQNESIILDDKVCTNELISESEYSEITNCDVESTETNIQKVSDLVNEEIKPEENPKQKKKYKPRNKTKS
jgi:hypothetical protein